MCRETKKKDKTKVKNYILHTKGLKRKKRKKGKKERKKERKKKKTKETKKKKRWKRKKSTKIGIHIHPLHSNMRTKKKNLD